MVNKQDVNWEKIGIYLAVAGVIFMFWQAWRDIHKDHADLRERITSVEVKIDHLQGK